MWGFETLDTEKSGVYILSKQRMIDIKRPKDKTMESYIPKLTIEENENKENYERSEKEK